MKILLNNKQMTIQVNKNLLKKYNINEEYLLKLFKNNNSEFILNEEICIIDDSLSLIIKVQESIIYINNIVKIL